MPCLAKWWVLTVSAVTTSRTINVVRFSPLQVPEASEPFRTFLPDTSVKSLVPRNGEDVVGLSTGIRRECVLCTLSNHCLVLFA